MKLYLAHPFDSRSMMRKWELEFEKRTGIDLLNPFYDAEGRTGIEKCDAGRQERYEQVDPTEIVSRDILLIQQCDGIVAVVDGALSYGTIMEIVWAYVHHKPIYLIVTNGHHQHPWLVAHATKVYTSFEDFDELEEVANG